MKSNRIKTVAIFMCCIVPAGVTACQSKEDKGQSMSIITSTPKSEYQNKANSALELCVQWLRRNYFCADSKVCPWNW